MKTAFETSLDQKAVFIANLLKQNIKPTNYIIKELCDEMIQYFIENMGEVLVTHGIENIEFELDGANGISCFNLVDSDGGQHSIIELVSWPYPYGINFVDELYQYDLLSRMPQPIDPMDYAKYESYE